MQVRSEARPFAEPPPMPEGATWARPPRVIQRLLYRADGQGYLPDGHRHLFVLPAEGGTPRQLASGAFDHDGPPAWTPDGKAILVSTNRRDDWEYHPLESDVYEVGVADGSLRALTDREGPDRHPVVSPDGRLVAYLGFDDRRQGYQVTRLHVMNRDRQARAERRLRRGRRPPCLERRRQGRLLRHRASGQRQGRARRPGRPAAAAGVRLGGGDVGRPYEGGSYSVARTGRFAYTHTRPEPPPDVAIGSAGGSATRITRLSDDLLGSRALGAVEEIAFESSHDRRPVQGWIVKPPGFDPARKVAHVLAWFERYRAKS